MRTYKILFLMVSLMLSQVSLAQTGEEDLEIIELELEKKPTPAPQRSARPVEERVDVKSVPVSDLSDLGKLAPFAEVSVLQKRFMPKTGRFQLFGGLGLITNDPFFTTFSAVGKASYFFSEEWGLELNYFANSTSERQATKELKEINNVVAETLVQPESYVGLDIVWVPIYGKMTWFDEKIVPFDLYFSAGYGTTKTKVENAGTLHLATGQIFSITKAFSLRWDFSWNFYNATGVNQQQAAFNNLFLTVGASFFFPEAGYR